MLAQDPSRGVEIEDSIVADIAAVPTLIVKTRLRQTWKMIADPFCSLPELQMMGKGYVKKGSAPFPKILRPSTGRLRTSLIGPISDASDCLETWQA